MSLVNVVEEVLTDKYLSTDPSDPIVPSASFKIQPASDATCSHHVCPFPAMPKEHPEDFSLHILFGGQTQFRSAGRAQGHGLYVGHGFVYWDHVQGEPLECKKQHQHRGLSG